MGKVLAVKKNGLKQPKKAKKKIDYSYPKVLPRHSPIHLQYTMNGVCASLKNSQQIVPDNDNLVRQLELMNERISSMENKGEQYHKIVTDLRKKATAIHDKVMATEAQAIKKWLIQCQRYKKWLKKITPPLRIWMDDMASKHGITFPVGQINLKVVFYFNTLHRRDGPNKEQAIFDMLKLVKFIPDDQWTTVPECNWKCTLYRPRPRTEIYITIIDQHRSLWSDYLVEAPRKRNKSKNSLSGMVISELDTELK